MPSRSSPGSVSGSCGSISYRKNGATTGPSTQRTTETWTDSVTFGDNDPKWRDNLRRGLSATTSMNGSKVEARLTNGYVDCQRPKGPLPSTGIYRTVTTGHMMINTSVPSQDPSGISSTKANASALGKFGNRVREVNTSFEGGVFLGELAQTINTIKNPARGLRKLVDDWRFHAYSIRRRSGRIGQYLSKRNLIQRTVQNLSDAWLEVQFGWKPLLNDIDAASEALAVSRVGRRGQTKRVTAAGESSVVTSQTTTNTSGPFPGIARWYLDEVTTADCQVIYRGAVRLRPLDPRTMSPHLLGFNPSNWAPTAWELVPWSFLIDYFTNIGEIVNGWSTPVSSLAWVNKTTRRQYRKTVTSRASLALCHLTDPDVNHVAYAPAKYVCVKSSVLRAKYEGSLTPDLVFEIPRLGSLKWLNIAALVAGRSADRRWSYGD